MKNEVARKTDRSDPLGNAGQAHHRAYWLCQLGGWGAFLAINAAAYSIIDRREAVRAPLLDCLLFCFYCAVSIYITHRLRRHVSRWLELGWFQLLIRLLPALLLAALFSTVAIILGFLLTAVATEDSQRLLSTQRLAANSFIICVNTLILLATWIVIYCWIKNARSRREGQVEILRLTAQNREAEFRALKAQVNPHFLFNSLNSLRALISENPDEAIGMVTKLANIFRYSLNSVKSVTVSLQDEIRMVSDYLSLEQIRLQERLVVRWDIPDVVLANAPPVPPLILQTLAENAVKHGISPRRTGGEIAIGASIDQRGLCLRVSNPGQIDSGVARLEGSTGLGLELTRQRLHHLYGTQAYLELSTEAEQVVALAVIPLSNHSAAAPQDGVTA